MALVNKGVFISVIVCTYNRDKYIGECLMHLDDQLAPKDMYEVLIIDNNSTDDTRNEYERVVSRCTDTNFAYILERNQGLSYARNRGVKEAGGDILVFIDDDAFVVKDYVLNIAKFFSNYPFVQAGGGKIVPKYESCEPKWMSKYLLPLVAALDMGDEISTFKRRKFPIGANMFFKKEVFDKYGLFDVNLGRNGMELEAGEEKDLFYRLMSDGQIIYYVPGAIVSHIIPVKRVEEDYIRKLAYGVGKSESKRLREKSMKLKMQKIIEEVYKVFATIVLALVYSLKLEFQKAQMLVKFRYWVIFSLLSN